MLKTCCLQIFEAFDIALIPVETNPRSLEYAVICLKVEPLKRPRSVTVGDLSSIVLVVASCNHVYFK